MAYDLNMTSTMSRKQQNVEERHKNEKTYPCEILHYAQNNEATGDGDVR
jgi:hypothetical protein